MRTYDITFDKTKYDLYANDDNCAWWKTSVYDNIEKEVLELHKMKIVKLNIKIILHRIDFIITQKKKNL